MITAVHTLVYSDDAPATRAFFKDVLKFPFVSEDENGTSSADPADWLIFGTGAGELGVHPTSGEHDATAWTAPRQHQISLMCDQLEATMDELASRGAQFNGDPRDMGFGRGILLRVPGADDILLYQPKHAVAYHL